MFRTKTILLFSSFLILALACNVFSQQLRSSDPGAPNADVKHYEKSGEPVLNSKPNVNPPRSEVGSFGLDGFLGGLNGSGNYVNVPSNAAFDQNFDGSMEMWIYPLAVGATQELIEKGLTSNNEFMWGLAGNIMYFRIGTTPVQNTGGTVITPNVWTHIAVTWTGGGPFTITFYVNGVQSGATQNNTGTWPINTDPIRIGGPCPAFSGEVYNGYMDEVRFWEPARTLVQITTNRFIALGDGAAANASNALTSSSSYSGLISSWTFNTGGTAFDDISGFNGAYTGTANAFGTLAGQPIPYNFALLCPGTGSNTSYVGVPNNAALTLTSGGTAECWVKPNSVSGTQEIISKSATSNTQYMFGLASGAPYMRFGTSPTVSVGFTLTAGTWYHLAWVWSGSPGNYQVSFYQNGQQIGSTVTNTGTQNATADPLTIGDGQGFPTENYNGYVDEVRLWNVARNVDQIRSTMFASCRGIVPNANLVACWNFDSNLNNFSATAGINGTFSTGGTNNCRLSAYANETSGGAIGTNLLAHATVINRNISPNPFPGGFAIRVPNIPIPDLATTNDNLVMPGSGTVTSVEVMIALQHTFVNDLTVRLTAPNAQQRNLIVNHGSGNGSGIRTFIVDGGTLTSVATFMAPWSNVAGPDVAMTTFGGSPVNGTWQLSIIDGVGGDSGKLIGWGIRLNGSITGVEPITGNIPKSFQLYQNYPNPFNPTTNIKFDIPRDANVKMVIFDMLGREVKSLVNEFKKAGTYDINFDASNIASGTYFYKIEAGDFVSTKKMILIK